MSDFNQSFAKILKALNAEQLEAVQRIEGPVLVVAGPGTGKTHILSARIGQILTETDTSPHNILCLTFTDAGVRAMRERLHELIGPAAQKVHIFTFHSFCNKIIQEHLDLFGRQDIALVDALERQELIRNIIDELSNEHPLTKGRGSDLYFYEKHLADLFKVMKTEAWLPEFVVAKTDEYLESLPTRKAFIYQITKKGQFEKGDLKQDELDEEILKMSRLKSAALLYPKYEQILRGARRYDFDDMILWVIDAFEKYPFLLRNYQEQYLYFLVDEYQDTNGSQNKILSQLIEFWDRPNVFIVGDDDQAIYEFQGARLKSLVDFYDKYEGVLKTVILKENYRSSQKILDATKSLIDLNNLRIINQLRNVKIDKRLVAEGHLKASETLPMVVKYPNRLHEITGIVTQIEALKNEKYPLSNVAIIYARHREIENLVGLLDKKGIPYQTKRRVNILDTPIIQNLRLVLSYISLESDSPLSGEHLLFKVLNINFLDINQNDIFKLIAFINSQNNKQTDDTSTPFLPWRDVLFNLPKLEFEAVKNLKNTVDFLKNALKNRQNQSLLVFIETVYNQSGLLNWVTNSPNKIWSIQILNTFFEFIKSETDKKPRLELRQLLNIFDILDRNRIAIELVQNFANTEGVVLTTAHSAKGLEFDRVFVLDAVETEWENAKSGGNSRFRLPDTLTYTTEENATEARRRLFYVALTRAKEHLQISYSENDERGKPLSKSQFLGEIEAFVSLKTADLDVDILEENQVKILSEGEKINVQLIENEFITEVLRDFKISVSALNSYLYCPLSFYFEYILKVPSVFSEAARYGTAMHFALRKLFGEMLRSKEKQFPNRDEFVKYFEVDLQRQRGYFTEKEYRRRLEIGREHLRLFYTQNSDIWSKDVQIEKSVFGEVEGVPIKGVLDKIEFKDDGTAHVVDYKTGKPEESRVRKPTAKNPNGGAYWRQLVFYKILYENYRANLVRVKSGEIAYLEPDAKGVFKSKNMEIPTKDVEILRGLIVETWGKIHDRKFDGCGKAECNWCNFVKNNQAPDSFRNLETENLDD